MADTLGSLIDKLLTADLKMWNNQEILYEIRRMDLKSFKEKYFKDEEKTEELWLILKKCCDLNVQRNQLIDEIDSKSIEMINAGVRGEELDNGSFVQRKHKTYGGPGSK